LIYEKEKESLCFIHIPRTGGRHVFKVLTSNYFLLSNHCAEKRKTHFYDNTEYMHLTYDKMLSAHPEVKDMKKIVIIRNPIEKFKSAINSQWAMNLYLDGYNNFSLMKDHQYFNYIMKEKKYSLRTSGIHFNFIGLANTFTNWFRPQVEFFNKDFYVWKFENGFGDEFIKFLTEKVNIDINTNVKDTYVKKSYDEKIEGFSLSKELKENVLNFYKEDYELWKQL
jgi:hypothetical protein